MYIFIYFFCYQRVDGIVFFYESLCACTFSKTVTDLLHINHTHAHTQMQARHQSFGQSRPRWQMWSNIFKQNEECHTVCNFLILLAHLADADDDKVTASFWHFLCVL